MLKKQVFPYYRQYVKDMAECYSIIKQQEVVGTPKDLCAIRQYYPDSVQWQLLHEMNMCAYNITDVSVLGPKAESLGLITKGGMFLLDDRYVIPVFSARGDLLTLIGYLNDFKKYITVPSMCFSKEVLFFNIDHALELSWREFDGVVFVVEGIFDCLSLRALGLPAIATMGNNIDFLKLDILRLFKKVVYIPDSDETGQKALDRTNIKRGWKVPNNSVGVKLKGTYEDIITGEIKEIKDIDKAISLYDADSLRSILLQCSKSYEDIELLRL